MREPVQDLNFTVKSASNVYGHLKIMLRKLAANILLGTRMGRTYGIHVFLINDFFNDDFGNFASFDELYYWTKK